MLAFQRRAALASWRSAFLMLAIPVDYPKLLLQNLCR